MSIQLWYINFVEWWCMWKHFPYVWVLLTLLNNKILFFIVGKPLTHQPFQFYLSPDRSRTTVNCLVSLLVTVWCRKQLQLDIWVIFCYLHPWVFQSFVEVSLLNNVFDFMWLKIFLTFVTPLKNDLRKRKISKHFPNLSSWIQVDLL